MASLEGKRVVVMGLGRFGGGAGAARFCCEQGADVVVTDLLVADQLTQPMKRMADLPIEFRLGGHNVSDFTTADLIVVNPAVDRRDNRFLRAAAAAGVPLTSEIRLLVERLPDRLRTIGVTGTAGKSTTVAMIGHILRGALGDRPVHVGGNIGGSLLPMVDRIDADDWVVLELSSFMLSDLAAIEWSPHIAVVTNISDNHLDRHGTMAAYIAAKRNIVLFQSPDDVAVLGASIDDWPVTGRRVMVDAPYIGPLPVPGEHNRMNAAMATAACRHALRETPEDALADFRGLPHRLQLVADRHGVRCYNDSKSTTPDAGRLAIDSFTARTVHVILGGYDKRADLTELAHHAAERCAGIYTIGATGDAIADAAEAMVNLEGWPCRIERCETLDRAADAAMAHARPGEVVVLSPACASWDQFDHYEQRGERFVEHITR